MESDADVRRVDFEGTSVYVLRLWSLGVPYMMKSQFYDKFMKPSGVQLTTLDKTLRKVGQPPARSCPVQSGHLRRLGFIPKNAPCSTLVSCECALAVLSELKFGAACRHHFEQALVLDEIGDNAWRVPNLKESLDSGATSVRLFLCV